VVEYLEMHAKWSSELTKLRKALQATELEETVKWGGPCYTLMGKNVVGLGAFKEYVALWFHQGVFLKDPLGVLINCQEGVTKALRQWRFASLQEIKNKDIQLYLKEAILNQRAGKELKPARKKLLAPPPELANALADNQAAREGFAQLTPGRQCEYSEYIIAAKRASTKQSRLKKVLPMIVEGIGLNDKYRKS